MSSFLYILKSETNDIYYTGRSKNPTKRLLFHNSIEKDLLLVIVRGELFSNKNFQIEKRQKLPKEK
ncbi:MAG: GIY-YIG nuclease family protein [Ignavibacteria bacterium]|nr:GIY-YIG nuclease family protein [Ignavibacteria bacterium]